MKSIKDSWFGEMAQSAKCLLYNHKHVSLIATTHVKAGYGNMPLIQALVSQRRGAVGFAGQPGQLNKQTVGFVRNPVSKFKVDLNHIFSIHLLTDRLVAFS